MTPQQFEDPECAKYDPEAWFVDSNDDNNYNPMAAKICATCPYRNPCAEYAIQYINLDGMWGGLTPKQRATIRRDRKIRGTVIEVFGNQYTDTKKVDR